MNDALLCKTHKTKSVFIWANHHCHHIQIYHFAQSNNSHKKWNSGTKWIFMSFVHTAKQFFFIFSSVFICFACFRDWCSFFSVSCWNGIVVYTQMNFIPYARFSCSMRLFQTKHKKKNTLLFLKWIYFCCK